MNLPNLVALLQNYNHSEDWYLGKPSLDHQLRANDRLYPGQRRAFLFATGGAGFCISKGLARKMNVTHAGFIKISRRIRNMPDDVTVGYLVNNLLQTNLTVIQTFYSHTKRDQHFANHTRLDDIKKAITLSYPVRGGRSGAVKIPGFFELVEKYHVSLKKLMQQGICNPEFYGDLVYKFKKIIGNPNFSNLLKRIVNRFKRAGYSLDIMRQTASLVFNPIMVEGYAALFSCTAVVQASDSMTASM